MSNTELKNSYAVVTGSSSGIGREIAIALAESGADIFIHGGHSHDAVARTVKKVAEVGVNVKSMCIDLADEANQETFLAATKDGGRTPDIWVNNAGVDTLTGPLASADYYTKLDLLWRVDVLATIRLSRRIGDAMRENHGGSIINLGWDQVATGMEGDSGEIFSAIKGAVTGFTRSLAKTLAPHVRVNGIAPGWIKTKWGETAPESWQKRAIDESLLERWGTPRDIAQAAVFLASERSSFITGQIVAVNGGRR